MCCCGKPVINGEMGYKWQPNDAPSIREPHAPALREGEELLFDEPGRCGGLDSHCHHFRITKDRGQTWLLVRHGGGDERMKFGWIKTIAKPLESLDSNGRYWLLCAAFHGMKDAVQEARETERTEWKRAAAEKRIKTRKYPARGIVKVWIEPATNLSK